MNRFIPLLVLCNFFVSSCQQESTLDNRVVSKVESIQLDQKYPTNVTRLLKGYPDIVVDYVDNYIIFWDSTIFLYNDSMIKNESELLSNPDIEDMFHYQYTLNKDHDSLPPSSDPGRIRNNEFFNKVYGASKKEVEDNLTEVIWCPTLVNKLIRVNTKNGAAEAFVKVSNELDQHPEFANYVSSIGGTFNYRNIKGTNRLSMHSYGITIDINVSKSNYWQWDSRSTDEKMVGKYKNSIPLELVHIFEKHGFIWGGAWRHYDMMHFEYRPELITNIK